MKTKIGQCILDSITVKQKIIHSLIPEIEKAVNIIVACYKKDGKVIIFGNGGSASDAQHIAAELVGKFYLKRSALNAIALTTNTSILTSLSNDFSFDIIFARQIESLARKGDVIIALSTSGNSKNVLLGLEKAKQLGCKTISLTGMTGGQMKPLSDVLLNVHSDDTPRIQESHVTIYHIICELVESALFKSSS